jgi:hypothetical protein
MKLPPEKSPVYQLVSKWRKSALPKVSELSACRAAIFTAAVHQMNACSLDGIAYNPLTDNKFLWACQWIDCADPDMARTAIDPTVEFAAHLLMDEPIQSHKHLAAADT